MLLILLVVTASVCLSFNAVVQRNAWGGVRYPQIQSTATSHVSPSSSLRQTHILYAGPGGLLSDPTLDTGMMFAAVTPTREEFTDEQYEEFLEDMIYGGDLSGYVNRRAKDIVSEDFLDFLDYKLEETEDADEKSVLQSIVSMIEERLRKTDGMGADSEVLFEMRLDKLLFAPPNTRKQYIEENVGEMTDGFVAFVQKELKSSDDTDSKVVIASLLQLIGQIKNQELLSADGVDAALLKKADATLGDQFAKAPDTGGLSFDSSADDIAAALKSSSSKNAVDKTIGDRYERILGGLLFSQNDILEDVLNNLQEIDEEFVEFLKGKVLASEDLEERVGLSSLQDTISFVLARVAESQEAEGSDSLSEKDEELNLTQVKARVREMQTGKAMGAAEKDQDYGGFAVQDTTRDTFKSILTRFEDLSEDQSLAEAVEANYHLCDYQFMNMLKAEAEDCFAEGANIEGQQYLDLLGVINAAMAARVTAAQAKLEQILSKRDPKLMEGEIMTMARKGEVDEALVLLIEANAQQAEAAGAMPVVAILKKLLLRVSEEKEKTLPDEQRVLRALLRMDDPIKRKNLLNDAFEPTRITNPDGTAGEGAPLMTPPSFMNVLRTFVESFGNVEDFKIMDRAKALIEEAQEVATALYGEGMTPREQQKRAWDQKSVSIWDLESYEEELMLRGEEAPWHTDDLDNQSPEDVLQKRVQKSAGAIGGDSGMNA